MKKTALHSGFLLFRESELDMKRYTYLFFDLDGTITDSAPGIINSVAYAFDKMGIAYTSKEGLRRYIGPPLVEEFMRDFAVSEARAREIVAAFREYFAARGIFENALYAHIPQLLEKLKAAGYTLVLATSKPEHFARQILAHFDIDRYFAFIGGSAPNEEARAAKPEVLSYCMASLGGLSAADCVMIGDRKYDVAGAFALGMDAIGVAYGYGSIEELRAAGATYIARTVEELKLLLI